MISAKRAVKICLNPDREERERLIDTLSEDDTKYLLKIALRTMRGEDTPDSGDDEE